MASIRSQVRQFYKENTPSLKATLKQFSKFNQNTIKRYYMECNKEAKGDILGDEKISPKDVLYQIFTDKRQHAQARVSAINTYLKIEETIPEQGDSALSLYNKIIEKRSLKKQN